MTRLAVIRPGRENRAFPAWLVLAILLATPLAAQAHPDILLQIEGLDRQIEVTPGDPDLYIKRGELHRRHGDLEQSARDLAIARQLSPAHPLLDWYEGRMLFDAGKFGRADSLLSRYLEAHPEHAAAWRIRADARLGLGRFHAAATDLSRAIRIGDQPGPGLFRSRALALIRADEGNVEAIETAIGQGLARFPSEVSLLGLAVDVALWQGLPGSAKSHMSGLPESLSSLPQWRFRAGILACLEGDQDSAARRLRSLSSGSGEEIRLRAGTWDTPPADTMRELARNPRPPACSRVVKSLLLAQSP